MTKAHLLVDQVSRIVGLASQPVLRNLLITQCYHDLSLELGRVLEARNSNWCTFATWASKTAGRFIRNDEVPGLFRNVLCDSPAVRVAAQRVSSDLRELYADSKLEADHVLELGQRVVHDVSGQITAGNLKVFSELAPIFARFIRLFDAGSLDEAGAARLIAELREGPSAEDGQSLLKEALEHYVSAAKERDPTRKAQHMLAANALTGLHEQIRLQAYIAGSLNAPIHDVFSGLWREQTKELHPSRLSRLHALFDKLAPPFVHEIEKAWDLFSATELMTLAVPGQLLHLGRALPPPAPKSPLYPGELTHIVNDAVHQLLEQYQALDPDARGNVGATNWSVLAQRMRYIIALFRSRQQLASMFDPPFAPEQVQALWQDKIPSGPLG